MGGTKKIKAATWVPSEQLAGLVRKCLVELDYSFERRRTFKSYSKLMFVLSIPRNTYVFDFKVTDPADFRVQVYDVYPTPSAVVHFFEVEGIDSKSSPHITKLVALLSDKMPRKPWKITMSERFRYGFLAPEYVTAKGRWMKLGAR